MEQKATSVLNAAHALGVGKTKLYELISQGHLRTIKVGRRRLVVITSVDRLLAGDEQ